MKWTSEDIDKIRIDRFLEACGYEYVGEEKSFEIYNVPEVTVDGKHEIYANPFNNYWYGARYGEKDSEYGQLRDLVGRIIHSDDIRRQEDYIRQAVRNVSPDFLQVPCYDIEAINRHKQLVVEMSQYDPTNRQEPHIIKIDITNLRLTDFMRALGQEQPVAADGNLRIYKAPYDPKGEPTMVINAETNLWRDTKSGAYGGIYDLAYELTGSCNMSELNLYIAGQMSGMEKSQKVDSPKQEQESDKPKRRMRL